MFFLISFFSKISYFSVQLLLCFGGTNSSELVIIQKMDFLEAGSSSEQLLFQKNNFFRSSCFLKTVTFPEKLVLRNQLHYIYTGKGFPLAIIYSLKYIMGYTI